MRRLHDSAVRILVNGFSRTTGRSGRNTAARVLMVLRFRLQTGRMCVQAGALRLRLRCSTDRSSAQAAARVTLVLRFRFQAGRMGVQARALRLRLRCSTDRSSAQAAARAMVLRLHGSTDGSSGKTWAFTGAATIIRADRRSAGSGRVSAAGQIFLPENSGVIHVKSCALISGSRLSP